MFNINELVILLNNYCNLRCSYCSFTAVHKRQYKELTAERLRKAIGLFFDHVKTRSENSYLLCFNADGEALLSRRLFLEGLRYADSIRQAYNAMDVQLALVTNGTMVDQMLASELARYKVAVTVSIDGDAKQHNEHRHNRRGLPTHHKVLEGINNLREAGVQLSLRAVITPDEVDRINDTYHFLKGLGPSSPIKLRPMRAMDNSFSPPGWTSKFAGYYISCVKDLLLEGTPGSELPDDAYHFAKFINAEVQRGSYCGAGQSMLWMTPSGHFTICGLFSKKEENIGHIDDIHSEQEFSSMLNHPFAEKFRSQGPGLREPCLSCSWVSVCRGGCPALTQVKVLEQLRPPLCSFYSELGSMMKRVNADNSENREAGSRGDYGARDYGSHA